MIFGIGTDIVDVRRFEKWLQNEELLERYFNEAEFFSKGSKSSLCQHYAVRFAAKEAFSKALGTGICFDLREVFVKKNADGKPELCFSEKLKNLLKEKCGECRIFVSLSHEKEYAVANVVIEKTEKF